MEAIALGFVPKLGDLLNGLEMVKRVINTIYERKDLVADNKDQFTRVKRKYNEAVQIITHLKDQGELDFISNVRIRGFTEALTEIERKLQDWRKSIEDAKASHRVERMKHILDDCESNVNEILDFKTSTSSQAPNASTDVGTDVYVEGMNNVPRNPDRLTFDFATESSPESKLKAAVLSKQSNKSVAVIASGLGGAGKTCALRQVCREEEVKAKFPGGILFMQLGNEAKLFTIIQEVIKLALLTGGKNLAARLRTLKSLQEVCCAVAPWFNQRECLLLVDDIWPVNDITSEELATLETILSGDSRLIYTTRSRSLCQHTESVIEFKEKESQGPLARRMLMTHAGFAWDQQLSQENERAVSVVLEQCGDLPLALGIAGAAVRLYSEQRVENFQNAWKDYVQGCRSINEVDAEGHAKLGLIVDSSLKALGNEEDLKEKFEKLCIVRKKQDIPLLMLQCLWGAKDLRETMKWANKLYDMSVVRIRREDEGRAYVEIHDLVLDLAVDRTSEEFRLGCFKTLLCNYKERARERGLEVVKESRISSDQAIAARRERRLTRLLRQARICCGGNGDREIEGKIDVHTANESRKEVRWTWWRFEDDSYILDNLCRVLYESGGFEELLWLLSQPNWIVMRLQEDGMYYVNEDIEWGKSALRERDSGTSSHMTHLETVRQAAQMSHTFVLQNKREVWFQVHGRLLRHAQICKRTRRFVEKIEESAPRPWAKASTGLLQQANELLKEVIDVGGQFLILCSSVRVHHVYAAVQTRGDLDVYWTSYDRKMGLLKTRKFQTEGEKVADAYDAAISTDLKKVAVGDAAGNVFVWDAETCSLCRTFKGHDEEIYGVSLNDDGTRVATGSADSTIRIWDVENGEMVGQALEAHTASVWRVALSGDGSRVVSGSADGTVRIWEVGSGGAVGLPLMAVRQPCEAGAVRCVAFSGDGKRVVCGTEEVAGTARTGTVRIWEVESGMMVGQPRMGDVGCVRCVAFSEDGKHVASGEEDGTVRIWKAESGERVEEHRVTARDACRCVSFRSDGREVICGTTDFKLRIWEVGRRGRPSELRGDETVGVRCVALSDDGGRVVCALGGATLQVWDAASGQAVGQPLVGHAGRVECVALSCDGRRVTSGSHDGTLRVWDAQSGAEVARHRLRDGRPGRVAFSGDGTRVAYASYAHAGRPGLEYSLWVWRLQSAPAEARRVAERVAKVSCVAMSGDGSRVAFGTTDGALHVCDACSGARVCAPFQLGDGLVRVGANADGTRVLCESRSRHMALCDVQLGRRVGALLAPDHHAVSSMHVTWGSRLPERYALCWSENGPIWLGSFECDLIRTSDCANEFRDANFRPVCEIEW